MAIHKSVKVDDIIFIHHLGTNHANTTRVVLYRLKTRRGRTNGARVPMKFKKYFESLNIKTMDCFYDKDYFTAVGVERISGYRNQYSIQNDSVPDHILSIYRNKFTINEMLIDTMKFQVPKPSDSIKEMTNKIFTQNHDMDKSSMLPQDQDGLSELDMFNREYQPQEDNPYEFKFMV